MACLDGGIQRQKVGLVGDIVDQRHDPGNPPGHLFQLCQKPRRLACLDLGPARQIGGLADPRHHLVDRGRQFLDRRGHAGHIPRRHVGALFHILRLAAGFLGRRGHGLGRRARLQGRGAQGFDHLRRLGLQVDTQPMDRPKQPARQDQPRKDHRRRHDPAQGEPGLLHLSGHGHHLVPLHLGDKRPVQPLDRQRAIGGDDRHAAMVDIGQAAPFTPRRHRRNRPGKRRIHRDPLGKARLRPQPPVLAQKEGIQRLAFVIRGRHQIIGKADGDLRDQDPVQGAPFLHRHHKEKSLIVEGRRIGFEIRQQKGFRPARSDQPLHRRAKPARRIGPVKQRCAEIRFLLHRIDHPPLMRLDHQDIVETMALHEVAIDGMQLPVQGGIGAAVARIVKDQLLADLRPVLADIEMLQLQPQRIQPRHPAVTIRAVRAIRPGQLFVISSRQGRHVRLHRRIPCQRIGGFVHLAQGQRRLGQAGKTRHQIDKAVDMPLDRLPLQLHGGHHLLLGGLLGIGRQPLQPQIQHDPRRDQTCGQQGRRNLPLETHPCKTPRITRSKPLSAPLRPPPPQL